MTMTLTLGASQVAAALGYSPYATPLQVYSRLRGETAAQPDNMRMAMGRALETLVLTTAEIELGSKIHSRQVRVTSEDYKWLHATIDGEISPEAGVECKTTRDRTGWGEAGTNQIPLHYQIQAQTQAMLRGWRTVYVPVLFVGPAEMDIYEVAADAELQAGIATGTREFMARVAAGDAPDPTSPAEYTLRWPKDNGRAIEATAEIVAAHAELMQSRAARIAIDDREADLTAMIKKFMAESQELRCGAQLLATWKTARDGMEFDRDAFKIAHADLWAQFQKPRAGTRRFLPKEGAPK